MRFRVARSLRPARRCAGRRFGSLTPADPPPGLLRRPLSSMHGRELRPPLSQGSDPATARPLRRRSMPSAALARRRRLYRLGAERRDARRPASFPIEGGRSPAGHGATAADGGPHVVPARRPWTDLPTAIRAGTRIVELIDAASALPSNAPPCAFVERNARWYYWARRACIDLADWARVGASAPRGRAHFHILGLPHRQLRAALSFGRVDTRPAAPRDHGELAVGVGAHRHLLGLHVTL